MIGQEVSFLPVFQKTIQEWWKLGSGRQLCVGKAAAMALWGQALGSGPATHGSVLADHCSTALPFCFPSLKRDNVELMEWSGGLMEVTCTWPGAVDT